SALTGTTPVLCLVGTQGQAENWNDPRKSKQHQGIPLISVDFVDGVPMIARLLRELRVPLDWIESHDARRLVTTIGSTIGLFFVEDAARAMDDKGRMVIPAVDFVFAYGVKTVFGVGGAYPADTCSSWSSSAETGSHGRRRSCSCPSPIAS